MLWLEDHYCSDQSHVDAVMAWTKWRFGSSARIWRRVENVVERWQPWL